MGTIERALEEYTKEEVMDGDNKVECEFCKTLFEEKNMTERLERKEYKRRTISRICLE